jgi:RNA polymerase sigma-70 factor (ECF subfamily)
MHLQGHARGRLVVPARRSPSQDSYLSSSAADANSVSFWEQKSPYFRDRALCADRLLHRQVTAILPNTSGEGLELFAFDEAYVSRLREGDPPTESHFVAYFSKLIQIKLRARFLAPEVVDDLKQETFARVIRSLRADGGLRQANRLGPFVNSVCNNVLMEHFRSGSKNVQLEADHLEGSDKVLNLESLAISGETERTVRKVLRQLPERDQAILRAVFLEEMTKDEVCGRFGVGRDYLRVLLYRAKEKFRVAMGS